MTFRKSGLTWIVLLLSVMLSGCISRWTEDVELGDGTIIKVTRTEKYGGGGGIGESCNFCTFERAWLSFKYNGKRYRWKSLPDSEVPMIVDVVDGAPIVVSHSRSTLCPKIRPNSHDYSFYIYSLHAGDGWRTTFEIPQKISRNRNMHWYKPKYASNLSVAEKRDWVARQISGLSTHRKPEIRISDDAQEYCSRWR